jgi:uncharacterized repeat protein (TIGR01451 family)
VVLRDLLPPELGFVGATQGGRVEGREVVWDAGTLQPGDPPRHFQVTARCVTVTPGVAHRAAVTGEPSVVQGGDGAPAASPAGPPRGSVRAEAEASIEVRGLPAFRLNVTDRDDPVEVGSRTVYTIEVTNQGSLKGNHVQVIARVPPEMRFESAGGLAEYRVDGQTVTFAAKDGLEPQQTWLYTVEVTALKPGDARFQAELRTLSEPVVVQESTNVFRPSSAATP